MITLQDARSFAIHAQNTAAGFHALAVAMIEERSFERAMWFQARARHWHMVSCEWRDALANT